MEHNTKLLLLVLTFIFSSCKTQPDEKQLYLAGWEVRFNGDDECQKFIQTQAVDKETAHTIWSAVELNFKNDILVSAFDLEEGQRKERVLKDIERKFTYIEATPNQIFQLSAAASVTENYLGGEPPAGFNIPTFAFNAPFQYLGKLSKKDDAFAWLPFDLHLVAPVYLNIEKVYVDYSDPNNPNVLNVEELKKAGTSYDDLKPDSEIVFEKVPVITQKAKDFGSDLGHTGVPSWIQYPDIPTSPKNKKVMRFLCQLRSDAGVMTARSNVHPKDDWYKQYFEQMNFWGDGDLFVFFEPESKVACFFIQHT